MRAILAAFLLLLCLAPTAATAHPGVGIVLDRQGNVFFTDLVHVWRIAPDGRKSIAVRDVHTHELAIDAAGNLFGEDNRYLGGDRYRHRVWRRTPDGRVSDVVPWRDGFDRAYPLVWDAAGAGYWVSCAEQPCTLRRRAPDGRVSTFAPSARFRSRINWIAAGPAGSVYVVDRNELRRVAPDGSAVTLARGLGEHMMGLWPDGRGNVYVAVYGARAVFRVDPRGGTAIAARSPEPWGPSGVVRAPNGDLWILEYSTANEARVRRVSADGRVAVF